MPTNPDEVDIGRYRNRLALLAPGKPEDGPRDTFGQVDSPDGEVIAVWGQIEALSGSAFEQAGEEQVLISHRAEIRWPGALQIGKDWKVSSGGDVFAVQFARPLGNRRRKLELMLLKLQTA
jgi:SPP1 family predicted phage head-tail adaptor